MEEEATQPTFVCRSSLGKRSQRHGQVQDKSSKAPKISGA